MPRSASAAEVPRRHGRLIRGAHPSHADPGFDSHRVAAVLEAAKHGGEPGEMSSTTNIQGRRRKKAEGLCRPQPCARSSPHYHRAKHISRAGDLAGEDARGLCGRRDRGSSASLMVTGFSDGFGGQLFARWRPDWRKLSPCFSLGHRF